MSSKRNRSRSRSRSRDRKRTRERSNDQSGKIYIKMKKREIVGQMHLLDSQMFQEITITIKVTQVVF